MGLTVVLETELGARVDSLADPKNHLGRLLPEIDARLYPLLGGVDRYGDTVFNGLQMRRFLLEWADVSAKASTTEERDLVAEIDNLARRCRDEVHLYIRFVGD